MLQITNLYPHIKWLLHSIAPLNTACACAAECWFTVLIDQMSTGPENKQCGNLNIIYMVGFYKPPVPILHVKLMPAALAFGSAQFWMQAEIAEALRKILSTWVAHKQMFKPDVITLQQSKGHFDCGGVEI